MFEDLKVPLLAIVSAILLIVDIPTIDNSPDDVLLDRLRTCLISFVTWGSDTIRSERVGAAS